jgi:hypothetical protein
VQEEEELPENGGKRDLKKKRCLLHT